MTDNDIEVSNAQALFSLATKLKNTVKKNPDFLNLD